MEQVKPVKIEKKQLLSVSLSNIAEATKGESDKEPNREVSLALKSLSEALEQGVRWAKFIEEAEKKPKK